MGNVFMGKEIRYVCAQPANEYYVWQVDVMLNNFKKQGINLNQVDIVCWKQNGVIPEEWNKLANGYAARFFFYDDTRETKHYISSIRPNILKQHWLKHAYLSTDAIFYHDSDIIFTKPIGDWITDEMITDNEWYGSDTRWYIGHNYIQSKGDDVLEAMCEITNIDKQLVKDNELNSIGAQYLMKGVDYLFWNRVEADSENLYKEISELNIVTPDNLVLYTLHEGTEIRLGNDNLAERLAKLQQVWQIVRQQQVVEEYIDLRFDKQGIVTKPKAKIGVSNPISREPSIKT